MIPGSSVRHAAPWCTGCAAALALALLVPGLRSAPRLGQRITPDGRFFSVRIPEGWIPLSARDMRKRGQYSQLAVFRPAPGEEIPSISAALFESGRPRELKEPVDMAALRRGVEERTAQALARMTITDVRLGDDKQSVWMTANMQGEAGRVTYCQVAIPVQTGYIVIDGLFADGDSRKELHGAVAGSLEIDGPWRYKRPGRFGSVGSLALAAAIILGVLAARSNRKASGGYTGARPNWWKAPFVAILLAAGASMAIQIMRGAPESTIFRMILGFLISGACAGLAKWTAASELPFLRNRREAAEPRQPNPWKLGLCLMFLIGAAAAIVDPLRGPLYMNNQAELSGAVVGNLLVGSLGLWGLATELRRWREQGRRTARSTV